MSDLKQNIIITETTPKTKDVQNAIMKLMLKKNPEATVGEVGRNYENMKKYLTGSK